MWTFFNEKTAARESAESAGNLLAFPLRDSQLARSLTAILSRRLRENQREIRTTYYYLYKRTRAGLKEESQWS
jgi:hypothetical protein